jgi:hypothetical protein
VSLIISSFIRELMRKTENINISVEMSAITLACQFKDSSRSPWSSGIISACRVMGREIESGQGIGCWLKNLSEPVHFSVILLTKSHPTVVQLL